ncbi:transglutaminase-like domain-containing protein [Aestuariibacter salexigens]|uniref:transglutaminase-like domain-containing protein n=1 Tax=Aestuariibacter salexigens TaxID=226010 RepID=UPI000404FECF|nr:transglutaminase-like domain-containing protein [Aestuariibacter salexigens]
MKYVFPVMGLIGLLLLGGCQSTTEVVNAQQPAPHDTLDDKAFKDYVLYRLETPEQIFALDDDAKAFVKDVIREIDEPSERMEALVDSIFDRSEFNLLYKNAANTTATDTFHNRAANCLSMSIMTYAMAREAGFEVRFQDIKIPEYWTRREGFSLLNGHINLVIYPQDEPNMVRLLNTGLVVDFDPQTTRNHFPKQIARKKTIISMFYNNKGADALLDGSYSKAYAYFREAIKVDPSFDSPFVNLGFLYRLNEHYELAEKAYKQAISIDEDNLTAWENLAMLYEYTGDMQLANQIKERVHHKRDDNPFYHFILGEQELDTGHVEDAIRHYRRALALDSSRHEIYFGMAKAFMALGDEERSRYYIEIAKRRAKTDQDQERYQGKLDLLSQLNRGTASST